MEESFVSWHLLPGEWGNSILFNMCQNKAAVYLAPTENVIASIFFLRHFDYLCNIGDNYVKLILYSNLNLLEVDRDIGNFPATVLDTT